MNYFAYGSNLNPSQMFERCPLHRTLGVARLPGHQLVFPRFSQVRQCATAGIAVHAPSTVWGVIYQLADEDIPVLHFHEGYDPYGPPENNRHDLREIEVVRTGSSGPETVMTYVAIPDGTGERPSRHYVDTILDGARYHNLPRAWLVFLESIATQP